MLAIGGPRVQAAYSMTFWSGIPRVLLIALKLADYSNDQGESIYPAKSTIARF
jgi:hypothetical protein